MVIIASQIEVGMTAAGAPTERCRARAAGRRARCALAAGHASHHETHVRVRRKNGVVVGYTFAWL